MFMYSDFESVIMLLMVGVVVAVVLFAVWLEIAEFIENRKNK